MLKEEGRQVAQHQQSEGGGHAGHPSPTSLKSFWCNKYDLPFGSLWSIYTRGFRLPEEELETASQNVNIVCSVERVPVVLQGKNIQIYKVYKKLDIFARTVWRGESSKQIKLRYISVIALTSLQMPRQLVMIIAFGKILGANAQNVYIKFLLFWGWMHADLYLKFLIYWTKGFRIQQVCKNN